MEQTAGKGSLLPVCLLRARTHPPLWDPWVCLCPVGESGKCQGKARSNQSGGMSTRFLVIGAPSLARPESRCSRVVRAFRVPGPFDEMPATPPG